MLHVISGFILRSKFSEKKKKKCSLPSVPSLYITLYFLKNKFDIVLLSIISSPHSFTAETVTIFPHSHAPSF